jgi:hypothetical protein
MTPRVLTHVPELLQLILENSNGVPSRLLAFFKTRTSMTLKAQYAKKQHLGGVMMWSLEMVI